MKWVVIQWLPTSVEIYPQYVNEFTRTIFTSFLSSTLYSSAYHPLFKAFYLHNQAMQQTSKSSREAMAGEAFFVDFTFSFSFSRPRVFLPLSMPMIHVTRNAGSMVFT
jgi:hypothetical protein